MSIHASDSELHQFIGACRLTFCAFHNLYVCDIAMHQTRFMAGTYSHARVCLCRTLCSSQNLSQVAWLLWYLCANLLPMTVRCFLLEPAQAPLCCSRLLCFYPTPPGQTEGGADNASSAERCYASMAYQGARDSRDRDNMAS